MKNQFKGGLVAVVVAAATLFTAGVPAHAQQTGLVNVRVDDVVVQVPIGVAANVCNIQVAALALLVAQEGEDFECEAENETEIFNRFRERQHGSN